MHLPRFLLATVSAVFLGVLTASAQVPGLLNYQGRVAVGGVNFNGTGSFKFALVNGDGSQTFWRNSADVSPAPDGEPDEAVTLPVANGLYAVLLGDASGYTNMTAIPTAVFQNPDVRLRVWFNDGEGAHGSQLLTPDMRIAAVGYAMVADTAQTVPDGAITSAKLAIGAIGSAQLAPGAAAANLAAGGQAAVPSGGVILSPTENPALVAAGYVRIGTVQTDDSWQQRLNGSPLMERESHTAIWTGTEMIVWGGWGGDGFGLNDGGRYNPATNTWTAAVTPALFHRQKHTAIWTGNEMIVWGGYNGTSYFNNGSRYNPAADAWTAVAATGAPTARSQHTAVWTGTEMIVWGGVEQVGSAPGTRFNDGARYSPATDTWTAVTTTGAPGGRYVHTAVWTGSEMIVWGGVGDSARNDGGRYNPATDTWMNVPTTDAPVARIYHTAVWTGSEMIVWGGWNGYDLGDGGRYNPTANSWTAVDITGVVGVRYRHTAVWTGSEMIVWGGYCGSVGCLNSGGRYNPAANTWTAVPITYAPAGRNSQTAVWTGTEMIVWGGVGDSALLNDGGRYDPSLDTWESVDATGPTPRYSIPPIWTGSEMIIWGGIGPDNSLGSCYNPATDVWQTISTVGAPLPRAEHVAVWTGTEMIVWGGFIPGGPPIRDNHGGRYNPSTDTWTEVATEDAPVARARFSGVWTGTEMIVWGGDGDGEGVVLLNDGGRYDPTTNAWTALRVEGAPSARTYAFACWTGSEMIIWGGGNDLGNCSDGGRWNPTDGWLPMHAGESPGPLDSSVAVWTGTQLLVWGHYQGNRHGGIYTTDPETWTPMTTDGAPTFRFLFKGAWTGRELIVWGGYDSSGLPNTGSRYDPAANRWTPMTTVGAPPGRRNPTAVWTGTDMLIFGGEDGSQAMNDLWSYNPGRTMFLYQKP